MPITIQVYYTSDHALHDPPFEYFDGIIQKKYLECPDRINLILEQLKHANNSFEFTHVERLNSERTSQVIKYLESIHCKDYLSFLQSAYADWSKMQSFDDSYQGKRSCPLLGASYPPSHCTQSSSSILGKAGFYLKDLSCPIDQFTWEAVLASANLSLTAAENLLQAACRTVHFCLCRPPGHHAGKSFAAGYCYLNNAALGADILVQHSRKRVAIVDIDYHAGNGTQDIFYERNDVLTVSIHGDPNFEYPYYSGYQDEQGRDQGLGYHRNFPLEAESDDDSYLATLQEALVLVKDFNPDYMVISAGMDIFKDDPLGTFHITTNGIKKIGETLGKIPVSILVCLEGGYCNDAIGVNICNLLQGIRSSSLS